MKAIRREDVKVEHKGKEYTGSRVIEGSKKLFQTIHYAGKSRADGASYMPRDEAIMASVARIILHELIGELEKEK